MSSSTDEAARVGECARVEGTGVTPTHTDAPSQQLAASTTDWWNYTLLAAVPPSVVAVDKRVTVPAPKMSLAYHAVKRAIDIVLGGLCLMVALPIMLILAIIIRLDSPGPIIFRQYRVGVNARPFKFYKFRTMWVDAQERFPELYAYTYTDSEIKDMYFKVLDDPRLTRLGARLRKTSLDELPNFINVLLGDMALVGPRPELPEMLTYYTEQQLMKFSVKPGVTGLAQVTGRAVLRFQQTIDSDLEYCLRRSLWFDLVILAQTMKTILQRVGAF